MASQTFSGRSVPWGYAYDGNTLTTPVLNTTLVIDATGEKVAFSGRVWFPSRTGTKDIRRVGFLFGAVTKAGGSGLTVSLQDVSTAAGPPMQPDGTQDQTVAVANGDANFASNTWCRTGVLSADRTVAFGALLSVVIEYDGSGRQGADSVVVAGLTSAQSGPFHQSVSTLYTASWVSQSVIPNVILEFSDGTFGTLMDAFPLSAINSISFNSGSGADEVALEMTFPGPVGVDAAGGIVSPNASADLDFVFYEGTSAIANGTVSASLRHMHSASAARPCVGQLPAAIALAAGTTYRLAVKPTTANNVALYYFDVSDANHLTCHIGGTSWAYTSRFDAGAWDAPTTTRRPFLWPWVCALSDGVGGGGRIIGG